MVAVERIIVPRYGLERNFCVLRAIMFSIKWYMKKNMEWWLVGQSVSQSVSPRQQQQQQQNQVNLDLELNHRNCKERDDIQASLGV